MAVKTERERERERKKKFLYVLHCDIKKQNRKSDPLSRFCVFATRNSGLRKVSSLKTLIFIERKKEVDVRSAENANYVRI